MLETVLFDSGKIIAIAEVILFLLFAANRLFIENLYGGSPTQAVIKYGKVKGCRLLYVLDKILIIALILTTLLLISNSTQWILHQCEVDAEYNQKCWSN